MKKVIISLLAFVTVAVAFVSCQDGTMFKMTVEAVDSNGNSPVLWPKDAVLATWDDAMTPVEVSLAGIAPDSSYATAVMPKGTTTQGVRRFVYPAAVCAGEGMVMIPAVQSGKDFPVAMPCYAEAEEGKGELAFKSLCGVLRLNLTTTEKLACVQVSTEDSNEFMAGRFGVENYPFPVLKAVEGTVMNVTVDQLSGVDFSQGGVLDLYVAPNCYNTFTVTLVTEDGRTCVKHLKDDKYIVVERNVVCSVSLGQNEGELVFE